VVVFVNEAATYVVGTVHAGVVIGLSSAVLLDRFCASDKPKQDLVMRLEKNGMPFTLEYNSAELAAGDHPPPLRCSAPLGCCCCC